MPIIPNPSLARLRAGQVSIGFGVHHLRTVATPALAKAAGYDWLFKIGRRRVGKECRL